MNSSIRDNQNHYEGNGWSKYQIMVLQQLEDHNRVLQNLNKEIVDIKQHMAVSETELKLWRGSTMSALDSFEKKISHILYDDKGLNKKVTDIEKQFDIEEKTSMRIKAIWALYGAVVVFVTNVAIKIAEFFFKHGGGAQ